MNSILKRIRKIPVVLLVVTAATLYCFNLHAQPNIPALTGNAVGNPTLDVYFINVNQGNCILVKFPSGNFLLYDAGSTSSATDPNAIADTITKFTGGLDIGTIILSHPDDDHINIIPYIREAKNPRYVHISGDISYYDKVLGAWLKALPTTTDTVTYPTNYWKNNPDQDIDDNSANVDVYIIAANVAGDPNTQSIVISIDFDNVAVMLTGDATAVTERWILAKWPNNVLESTLLSFGHHGSNHSSSSKFLDVVKPSVGVFSASAAHMGYGHPRCSLVDYVETIVDEGGQKGITIPMHRIDCWKGNGYVTENNDLGVFLTATQGNILFRTDGTNYAVYVNRLQ